MFQSADIVSRNLRLENFLTQGFSIARTKLEIPSHVWVKIGEIYKDTYHVTLLAIVLLVAVSIHDIVRTIFHTSCDVIEV